jgi:ribosomal protein S27E
MQGVACPSCGAEAVFRSPALPYVTCAYCQSTVMRTDTGVQDVGKAAVLPYDISPIQLGTTGVANTIAFEVIGRVRWGWADGAWNEWLLMGVDGQHRWLGEAMGQFMLLEERDPKTMPDPAIQALISGGEAAIGTIVRIDGVTYHVADIKDAKCLGSEGELPFRAPKDWTVHSVDFRSDTGDCASFQRDNGEASFYEGRYVELADLRPKNLRLIDGWAMPAVLTLS